MRREGRRLGVVLEEKVPAVFEDFLVELRLEVGVGRKVVVGLGIHEVDGSLGGSVELSFGLDDDLVQVSFSGLQLSSLYW